jgi:hypothetical protein
MIRLLIVALLLAGGALVVLGVILGERQRAACEQRGGVYVSRLELCLDPRAVLP